MESKRDLIRTFTIQRTSSLAKMELELPIIGEMDIRLESQFTKISWK